MEMEEGGGGVEIGAQNGCGAKIAAADKGGCVRHRRAKSGQLIKRDAREIWADLEIGKFFI